MQTVCAGVDPALCFCLHMHMGVYTSNLEVRTPAKGMHEITSDVESCLGKSGLQEGVVIVFCRHTSCSLVIMENADPSARADLEHFMERLAPENDPSYTHTLEGSDDMPSHIRMALTRTSETIPFVDGRLCLGTWQGLFLWEHRAQPHARSLILSFQGVS